MSRSILTEVGIAAGTDEISDPAAKITIYWKAAAGAPTEPTPAALQASSLAKEWAAIISSDQTGDDCAALFADDGRIAGALGATKDDVIGLISNWPEDKVGARELDKLDVGSVDEGIAEWDACVAAEASVRGHTKIDYEKTFTCNRLTVSEPTAMKLWQGMLNFILCKGWVVKHTAAGNGVIAHVGPEVTAAVFRSSRDVAEAAFADARICATIVAASKLNWWMINHHVGQDNNRLDSFVSKVAKAFGLISDTNIAENKAVRTVIWIMGKLTSTRGLLMALGISKIVYADSSNTGRADGNDYAIGGDIQINTSADIKKRVDSTPAGAAVLTTYVAVANYAFASVYGLYVPPLSSWTYDAAARTKGGLVQDKLGELARTPARFHMGSKFLTGSDRVKADVWSDDDKLNLLAFIHAVAPHGTLAKAAVIHKLAEVQGSIVYSSIQSAKISSTAGMANIQTQLLI
jgi:hypothetical protein